MVMYLIDMLPVQPEHLSMSFTIQLLALLLEVITTVITDLLSSKVACPVLGERHVWDTGSLLAGRHPPFISSLLSLEFEFLLGSKSPELMSIFRFFFFQCF